MKLTIALLVLLPAVVAVGAYFWLWWSPYGQIIRGQQFEGLLMDPIPNIKVKQWKVPVENIVEMEAELRRFVADNPDLFNADIPIAPEAYRRHYAGFERDGRQFVNIKLYRKGFVSRRDWLNGILVNGGAARDNWFVRYYPDTHSFSNLYPFPIERRTEIGRDEEHDQ